MPSPQAIRQVYQRNPLAEVIAQVRFDSILLIDTQTPAVFQNVVRGDYPTYRATAVPAGIPPGIPQPLQRVIREMGAPGGLRQHLFGSQDARWEVILTRESLALKTKAYVGWQDFEDRWLRIRNAFEQAYQPVNSYASVNLRYVDVIQRSRLELSDVPWSELLVPEVAGELASLHIGADIDKMENSLHCRLDNDGSFLTLKTGIAFSKDGTRERCFSIDSDFHTHARVEPRNVQEIFQRFNRHSRDLFQWAIRDRLRVALQPIPQ